MLAYRDKKVVKCLYYFRAPLQVLSGLLVRTNANMDCVAVQFPWLLVVPRLFIAVESRAAKIIE
jgi:hypothetical protein